MADFVAVLKKTIDGLGETTPDTRRRVYQMARETISARLSALRPPAAPIVIERQKAALEHAIKTIEAEYRGDAETEVASSPTWPTIGDVGSDEEILPPPSSPDFLDSIELTEESISPTPHVAPRAPKVAEGPHFEVRSGKLALSVAPSEVEDAESQRQLQKQLRELLTRAEPLMRPVENRYPEMVNTLREYASAIANDVSGISVVNVWAIGSALAGFSNAYRQQNVERTLAEPLEPQLAATLDTIVRLHGAFIMGFDEGRELVFKSDKFLLDTKTIDEISVPGETLLKVIALNAKLLEERTVRANKPVADFVQEFGWHSSRVGFSAYVLVRNVTYEIIRVAIGKQDNIASGAAQIMTLGAAVSPAGSEFIHNSLPILTSYSAQILAFFNHTPEFRSYIQWAIEVLALDAKQSI